MIGIYKITNNVNNRAYVGQSVNIEKRFNKHKTAPFNPNNKAYDCPLYRAIRKYGLENFSFEIIEVCEQPELNDKEIYYIAYYDTYRNGYNQDEGGTAATHYLKLSHELVSQIIHRLKTSNDNSELIGEEFGVSGRTIREINSGNACRRDGETYPIRPPLSSHPNYDISSKVSEIPYRLSKDGPILYQCPKCGEFNVVTKGKLCVECSQIAQRRVERPEPLDLARMIKEHGFTEIGRRFGVDGNAVKKWCEQYGLPRRREDLIAWYNEKVGADPTDIPKRNSSLKMPVEQIDPVTNKVISTYSGVMDAARALGKTNGNQISKACNGKSPSAYGYLWRFVSTTSHTQPSSQSNS